MTEQQHAERPEFICALEKDADALREKRDWEGAAALYEQVVAQGHADVQTWAQLGETYADLKEYVRSHRAYVQALELEPDSAPLHVNIARPLYMLGEADEAAEYLERAIPRMDGRIPLENLAVMAPGVPKYSPKQILDIRRAYGLALARPDKSPAACWAEVAADGPDALRPGAATKPQRAPRTPGTPLRVAYLSAHFNQANYMGPVWALVNNHNRDTHQIYLLSDAPVNGVFRDYVPNDKDTVVEIPTASDAQLAGWIATQGIDLLVDLSGYSYPRRLTLFGSRPAPAVATWFNMYATSGLPGIDYIIGDDHVVRPGEETGYSETVLRLPQSYLTYLPWTDRPPVAPAPRAAGAPFTFGSLVSLYKITGPVVDAWSAMLDRAPRARLLLANADLKSTLNRQWLLERFARRGIDTARILLRDPAPHDLFLRYYDEVDLALDSFPYSGGTTTMEALWQGVPVLTQAGGGWPARTTGTLLQGTHLDAFCCHDVDEYITRGAALANGPETPRDFAALRGSMRERLAASPSLDGPSLARHMETLYDEIVGEMPA